MESGRILDSPACQRLMRKTMKLLEERIVTGISLLLTFCRFDGDTELGEMGLGNLLMLLSLRALSEGDELLMAVISQFCPDLAPLDSCHLAAWIKEDFNIPQELLARAARQALSLSNNPAIHLPPSLLTHILQPSVSQTIHSADGEGQAISEQAEMNSPAAVIEDEEGAAGPSGVDSPPPAETEAKQMAKEPEGLDKKLVKAVIDNEGEILCRLVAGGGDVNTLSPEGESLLHLAVKGRAKEAVKALLRLGARLNRRDRERKTPLHRAIEQDSSELVQMLLDSGADATVVLSGGQTLLMFALSTGSLSAAKALLSRGVPVDQLNSNGETPIFIALNQQQWLLGEEAAPPGKSSSEKATAAIRLLAEYKANMNVKNKEGDTPLHIAARTADSSVIQILVQSGAEINAKNNEGDTPLHIAARTADCSVIQILVQSGAEINATNNEGDTPLHIAARTADYSVIQILVQSGAEINAKNSKGETALHIGVEGNSLAVVEKLATLQADINCKNSAGEAPLHIAVSRGFVDIVDLLLEQKATIDVVNGNGCTPLYIAAEKGRTEIVEILARESANVNHRANNGTSVLFRLASNSMEDCFIALSKLGAKCSDMEFKEAVVKGDMKLLELFRENGGVDLNARDSDGNTALHWAAEAGKEAAVSWLLDLGLDINAKGWNDVTPLHYAAREGRLPVVQLLLDRGADVNSRNSLGCTPLTFSRLNKHPAVARLLQSKGGVE